MQSLILVATKIKISNNPPDFFFLLASLNILYLHPWLHLNYTMEAKYITVFIWIYYLQELASGSIPHLMPSRVPEVYIFEIRIRILILGPSPKIHKK